jgi:hypothetical protein
VVSPTRRHLIQVAGATIEITYVNRQLAAPVRTVADSTDDIPDINRTSAAPIHMLAEVTIDITPYQSCVRRTHSRARRGHD